MKTSMASFLRKSVFLFIPIFLFLVATASAQCAMCRATVENNVTNGQIGIGAGLNFGIMYLFAAPYTIIAVVGLLWYRKSKKNAKENKARRHLAR